MSVEVLGDAPIEARYKDMMNELAVGVDAILNGRQIPPETGFILMIFPFNDHGGRCNYISNARRDDVVVLLKEQLAALEGRVQVEGHG